VFLVRLAFAQIRGRRKSWLSRPETPIAVPHSLIVRVHHLNCGTMCPVGGRLMDGDSGGLFGKLVCHCLLVESDRGLVLVDTGFGLNDVHRPTPRLSPFFLHLNRIQLREEDTAKRQVMRLGFRSEDVRHIVLTHLDFDHAGGIDDFPKATVHVLRAEYEAAHRRTTPIARGRYRPMQWRDQGSWRRYDPAGQRWFGFEAVRELDGLPPELLLVPLVGHTFGHSGVAVRTDAGWLFNAGDAYFYRGEMDLDRPHCTPGLRLYQTMMEVDRARRLHNQERLRGLKREHAGEVRLFCAHDHAELEMALNDAPAQTSLAAQ
jgi:glyoxylase-like metal-dependent hydrolase (beta-lactamase superfamily II)